MFTNFDNNDIQCSGERCCYTSLCHSLLGISIFSIGFMNKTKIFKTGFRKSTKTLGILFYL